MLYESSGGIPHGRLAIADGAIKKVDVISIAREKKLRPSTSASLRRTIQENEELKRRAIQENEELKRCNENLQNKVDMHQRLLSTLFKEMGKELPQELLQGESSQPHGGTNSSHTGTRALDNNTGDGYSGGTVGSDNSSGNISDLAKGASNLAATTRKARLRVVVVVTWVVLVTRLWN